jgi:transposase-like protein
LPVLYLRGVFDIKQRGLEIAPDIAVGDGALGFWKAIEEVFPGTRRIPLRA